MRRTDGRTRVPKKKTVGLIISLCGGWRDTFCVALTALPSTCTSYLILATRSLNLKLLRSAGNLIHFYFV